MPIKKIAGVGSRLTGDGGRSSRADRVNMDRLTELGRELLVALGEDPDEPRLADTPRRWAAWWKEFLEFDPGRTDTVFESVSEGQLVCLSGLRVWSLCEHHLLPFWCDMTIAYIPQGRIIGLSKIARVARKYAHRLQVQERLVKQVADEISVLTGSPHVAVGASGEHLCMVMRGIRTSGTMVTVETRGQFLDNSTYLALFSNLLSRGKMQHHSHCCNPV